MVLFKEKNQEKNQISYGALYEALLASIPSSVLIIDSSLRVISANRNFLDKSRRTLSNTLGRKVEEVFPTVIVDFTRLSKKIKDVFKTGTAVEGEQMEYRAPGLPARVYYYRLCPLKDQNGELENVLLLMDDITEQKALGEEIRRIERHLASVVESASDMVISMDPKGKIMTWNRAAENILGYRSWEVKDKGLNSFCAEEYREEMNGIFERLARRGAVNNVEISLNTKGGEVVSVAFAFSPMKNDAGEIIAIVALGRDLTEKKRLEAQLAQSAKMASLGVMAGGIAHEIRNPLGVAMSAANLLLTKGDDKVFRQEAISKIHNGIKRASFIIENLLRFARPPEEKFSLVDLGEVIKESLQLLTNQTTLQQIKVTYESYPDHLTILGNKGLLQQVFTNIILNASNAMPQGGDLIIKTTRDSRNKVVATVTDTGSGIPEENLSRIFDPFFTTMPVGKGTGLGLSVTYAIIQQHKGSIEVNSKLNEGTTVIIKFPLWDGKS